MYMNNFQLVVSLTFLTVNQISTSDVLPCNKQMTKKLFLSAQNKQLQRVSYRQTVARSHVLCVSYCHADPQCQSINYIIGNHQCELNNATRVQYPDNFITQNSSVYFDSALYRSCQELRDVDHTDSGVYNIYPTGLSKALQVYCDMETDRKGWIVIQRRQDGSVDFYRNWTDYQTGFGKVSGEFWLGNDKLRALTESTEPWQLRVNLEDWYKNESWSEYRGFGITGDNFTLHYESYDKDSTAGNALAYHKGMMFTTRDLDNDLNSEENCAVRHQGAWWYNKCVDTNLNGMYSQGPSTSFSGIFWQHWQNYNSIKKCVMMIRLAE